jgi:hypothetical protein
VKGAWLHGDSDKTLRIAKCKLQIEESGFSSNLQFAFRNSQFAISCRPFALLYQQNTAPRVVLTVGWEGLAADILATRARGPYNQGMSGPSGGREDS